jgi:hypothetical protein
MYVISSATSPKTGGASKESTAEYTSLYDFMFNPCASILFIYSLSIV